MLEISLFGCFDLKKDGASARATWTRQAHRLLALLTLNHNRPVSTVWIIDALLIPDSVLPQSLGELYDTLGREERHRLVHKNHQIHFDTNGVTVDLLEFDRLIGRGTQECLVQAIKLHRGGLLRDWEEEGWFSEERENSLADYLEAINSLVKAALASHDYDLTASYLRRYVNAYPEMDSAWSRLAEIYATSGNTLGIEQTRAKYLASLAVRSEQEGRTLVPSQRFMQACAEGTQISASVHKFSSQHLIPNAQDQQSPSPSLSHQGRGTGLSNAQYPTPGTNSPPHLASPTPPRSILADRSAREGTRGEEQVFLTPNTQYPTSVSEPVGGAVPPDSPFYIERLADNATHEALARRDSFILVKGPRQVGKSSLLVRLIATARNTGTQVVRTDWQKLPQSVLMTDRTFLLELAETIADQLELEAKPVAYFDSPRAAMACFEKFLKREVLTKTADHLVWVVDEADRLFDEPYRDDIFAMLRSWHSERAMDHTGLWQKLTVVMAYATEAYLFITNMDQSPFNVGTKLELDDFTPEQVQELNIRYGSPLQSDVDQQALYDLLGGHPYLVRRALQKMRLDGLTLDTLSETAVSGDSIFNDHLVRMRLALRRDTDTEEAVKIYLTDRTPPSQNTFLRLRAAGVMRGHSPGSMRPRCVLYDRYLRDALLVSGHPPRPCATD